MLERYASDGVGAFGYTFGWESPYRDGFLGSCHTIELPFIFGTYADPAVEPYAGAGTRADAVAANTQRAWTTLAASGAPRLPSGDWPSIGGVGRPVAILGDAPRLQTDEERQELRIWDELQSAVKPTAIC